MKKKITALISLLILSTGCFADGLNSLIGKSFKLDKETTQNYLKENGIVPEEHLHKLDKFMDHLVVRWKNKSIEADTWSGSGSSEYKFVAETKTKIILKVKNKLGEWNETRIILTEDGYWQETDVFPSYREKFTLYKPPNNESNESE